MELFEIAKYWVACSTESALQIFFDYEEMTKNAGDYSYIAAFDSSGKWLDERKIEVEDDGVIVFSSYF